LAISIKKVDIPYRCAGVTMLTFFLSHVIPGDPITLALGPRATEEQRISFHEKMGMDKPFK